MLLPPRESTTEVAIPLLYCDRKAVGVAWKFILDQGAPKPEKFLVSPLVRAIETMKIAYGDMINEKTRPVVVETSQEVFSVLPQMDPVLK